MQVYTTVRHTIVVMGKYVFSIAEKENRLCSNFLYDLIRNKKGVDPNPLCYMSSVMLYEFRHELAADTTACHNDEDKAHNVEQYEEQTSWS